jgi:hypothetical protein
MNLGSAFIKRLEHDEATIFLPTSFFSRAKHIKKISFGAKVVPCKVNVSKNEAIGVSSPLLQELHLPTEQQAHLLLHEDTLKIGPLIGIFTAGFTGSKLRPIGERSLLFAKYLSAGQHAGTIPFVFGVNGIDFTKHVINGYFYTDKGWLEKTVPFPNVIYDRLPNRKSEGISLLKKVKKTLEEKHDIPWYNPGFFDKWTIHQLASKDNSLKDHFPETILSPTLVDISKMLNKYGSCYLKPVNGSLGYGIYSIVKRKNNYYCRYRNKFGNRLRRFSSLEKIIEVQFKNSDLSSYICQQAIDLLSYDDKPYDFRIHTNKNSYGQWEMSAIAIKTAGTGSITTHTRFGGKVKSLQEVLVPDALAHNVENRLKAFTLKLSTFIDKTVEGNIAEIGYDIGIDTNGDLWVFEANSKPGRSIFSHYDLKENDIKTLTMPFEYGIHLTEQYAGVEGIKGIKQP